MYHACEIMIDKIQHTLSILNIYLHLINITFMNSILCTTENNPLNIYVVDKPKSNAELIHIFLLIVREKENIK